MRVRTPLALLVCAVCFSLCSESPRWTYRFVDKNLTWSEAQQFCRRHYSDLACVSSSEDNLRLPRPPGYSAPVWIGLYDDPTDQSLWKWTATDSSGPFMHWSAHEPRYLHEPQQCAYMYSTTWNSGRCGDDGTGICYSGSSPKVFHLAPGLMSWGDALTYCRTHYTDLALIESAEENTVVSGMAVSYGKWIGLSRSTGKWSDNRAVTFMAWHEPGTFKVYHEPFCAAQNMHSTWEVFSCQERRPFYCQDELKTLKFVKIMFSGHGLEDSAMNQEILDEIQKRFEAAGSTDVTLKWKTAPQKQEKKIKIICPLNV